MEVQADTSPPREPIDLNGNDLAEINLHSVESISDLYWVSGGHKATEGEDHSPQGLVVVSFTRGGTLTIAPDRPRVIPNLLAACAMLQASWAGAVGIEPLMSGSLWPELKGSAQRAKGLSSASQDHSRLISHHYRAAAGHYTDQSILVALGAW